MGTISPKSVEAQAAIAEFMEENMVFVYIVQMPLWRHFCALWILAMGMKLLSLTIWQCNGFHGSFLYWSKACFCDIDYDRCTISVESVKESITEKTKAVIVNSYAGDW